MADKIRSSRIVRETTGQFRLTAPLVSRTLLNDSSTPAFDLCRVFFKAIFSGTSRIHRIAPKPFTDNILERREVLSARRTTLGLARSLLAGLGCGQIERTAFQRPLGCLQHHFGSCLGQKDAPMARVAGRLGRSGRGFLRSAVSVRFAAPFVCVGACTSRMAALDLGLGWRGRWLYEQEKPPSLLADIPRKIQARRAFPSRHAAGFQAEIQHR
jgi:hypothetical protein